MTEQITAPRREALHLGLVLGGIAFFVALMLSVVNSATAPIIEQNTKEQEAIAFRPSSPTPPISRRPPPESPTSPLPPAPPIRTACCWAWW